MEPTAPKSGTPVDIPKPQGGGEHLKWCANGGDRLIRRCIRQCNLFEPIFANSWQAGKSAQQAVAKAAEYIRWRQALGGGHGLGEKSSTV